MSAAPEATEQPLSRERCMQILGWATYAGFSDEQLQAAVHNQQVRERWAPPSTACPVQLEGALQAIGTESSGGR